MPDWFWRFVGYVGWFLDWLAQHASIATATIAILAAVVAYRSFHSQRETARKRAALDVFIKTEMDKTLLDLYAEYKKVVPTLKGVTDWEAFVKDPKNACVASYLNVHELVAVGVREGVLDEEVCYRFWGDQLIDEFEACEGFIKHVRGADDGTPETYIDVERLAVRWKERADKARERIRAERAAAGLPP